MIAYSRDREIEEGLSRWEAGLDVVVAWAPYVTLSIGLVLGLLSVDDWGRRGVMIALALGAALWSWIMLRRYQEASQTRLRVYFAGFLVFGVALMTVSPSFFVYVITGFIHAFILRPPALGFVGVGLTSLLINSTILGDNPTSGQWWTYWIVVVIQTTIVGFGVIGGEKIGVLSQQRGKMVRDLETALAENAALQEQLMDRAREAGIVEERQRMAREIHDTIAQGLTGVITQLEAAGQVRDDPERLQMRIDNATRLARESLAEARRSVNAMMPTPLEENTLPEALSQVSQRWSKLHEVPATMTTTGDVVALRPEVEVTILRIAQEALANVAKHADATRVGVTLSYMDDVVTIDIRDDGVGFSENGLRSGFGLEGMRQRVEALSGSLDIESAPGEGTAVSASLPSLTVGSSDG